MAATAGDLMQRIVEAFTQTPYPGDGRIALHQCEECEGIRQDFRGQSPTTLRRDVIEHHFDSLPMLSPDAFHYFIPAYMRYAIDHPDSNVARFAEYSLAPTDYDDFWRERFLLFTPSQKDAVIAFLEFLKTQYATTGQLVEGEDDEKRKYEDVIDDGIKIWRSIA